MSNKKVISLYKLSRKTLFKKNYFCEYCDMIDSEGNWLQNHIYNIHDECGRIMEIFYCRRFNRKMFDNEILIHLAEQCLK